MFKNLTLQDTDAVHWPNLTKAAGIIRNCRINLNHRGGVNFKARTLPAIEMLLYRNTKQLFKAKFHYVSWFGAGSEPVRS